MGARKPNKPLSREDALAAKPIRLPVVSSQSASDGGVRITVSFQRPRWQRWFGAGTANVERSFDLDAFGREVYEACDGGREVRALIKSFAAAHHLSEVEAELSVTKFLQMLMSRGLIAMAVRDGDTNP